MKQFVAVPSTSRSGTMKQPLIGTFITPPPIPPVRALPEPLEGAMSYMSGYLTHLLMPNLIAHRYESLPQSYRESDFSNRNSMHTARSTRLEE
ncbi:unnamed protein product [Caenorhabditis brenneri]